MLKKIKYLGLVVLLSFSLLSLGVSAQNDYNLDFEELPEINLEQLDDPYYQETFGESAREISSEQSACEEVGGQFDSENMECLGVDKNTCEVIGGTFDGCASPCRNDPDAEFCIEVCEQVCFMGEKDGGGLDPWDAIGFSAENFDECEEMGGAVMESYPRQCMIGGEVFVEEIGKKDDRDDDEKKDDDKENIALGFIVGLAAGAVATVAVLKLKKKK